MARQVAFDDVLRSNSLSSQGSSNKDGSWWVAWAKKFRWSDASASTLESFQLVNPPGAENLAIQGFSSRVKRWGTCKTLAAHLIVILALALSDLVYASEHGVEKDFLSTTLLAFFYFLLALALVLVAFVNECQRSLGWTVQSLMHIGIIFYSAHWRRNIHKDDPDGNVRLVGLCSILQLLMLVLYKIQVSASIFLLLATLIAALLFDTVMSIWAVGSIENLLLIMSVGLLCILSPRHDLKGVREILTPLLSFDISMDKHDTATTDTHLQQLLYCIARAKQRLEECSVCDDGLCELLGAVFGSISHELSSPSLLQINQDLSHEPAMTAAFVHATFEPAHFSQEWFDMQHHKDPDDTDEDETDRHSKHKSLGSRRTSVGSASLLSTSGFISEKNSPMMSTADASTLEDRVEAILATLVGEDFSTSLSPRLENNVSETLANGLGKWDFDILMFSELHRFPLLLIGQAAFAPYADAIHVDMGSLASFLSRIESRYEGNAYHSAVHGASVMNGMLNFVQLKRTPFQALDHFDKFVGLVACAAHDVGHNGFTNRFHMIAATPFAQLFNDQSILENMHCAVMFATIGHDASNFLVNMAASKRAEFRNIVLDMILGTDLAKHMQLLSKFRQTFLANTEQKEALSSLQSRKDILSFALKCIDVGHATMTFSLHARWSLRITTEFFSQGDEEQDLGLPCSPFCDRHGTKIVESQRGFFDFIVVPLYTAFDEFANSSRIKAEVLSELRTNHAFWKNYDGADFNYSDPMSNLALLRAAFGSAKRDCVVVEAASPAQRRHTLLGMSSERLGSSDGRSRHSIST